MSSQFGKTLTLSTFGASHGMAIGAVIDGLPCGPAIDIESLQAFLKRRAPGQNRLTTQRKEGDVPHFLSGLVDGKLSGSPLAFYIENTNQHSKDYGNLRDIPRPSHADYTAQLRYGEGVDMRGGGHFSGRLTAPLCVAGGIALQLLAMKGIQVAAHCYSIGPIKDMIIDAVHPDMEALIKAGQETVPMVDVTVREDAAQYIDMMRKEQNSTGGVVEVFVTGYPAGIGNPNFDGVENRLASAFFGVPGLKGIAFGSGFEASAHTGAEENDAFTMAADGQTIVTKTNHCGGIQGGITNGMPLIIKAAMKPTPSIAQEQDSVSLSKKENTKLIIKGRHDPCITLRAVPVFEAVTALVLLDFLLPEMKEWS